MEHLTSCPLCKSTALNRFIETVDFFFSKEHFRIDECADCGLLFTNPRPLSTSVQSYYESEKYISHSNTNKGFINKIYKLARSFALHNKHQQIKKYAGSGALLDIGSGTGHLLNYLRKKGYEVTGVEPGPLARKASIKDFNLTVFSSVDDVIQSGKSFHIITMWHVLEHVYDLEKEFLKIKQLLERDGILFAAVPNPESYDADYYKKFWAAYDVPRHVYHFKKTTIRYLADKYNFSLIKIIPMLLDSYYVSLLSEKYKHGNTNYLNAMKIGFLSNQKAKKQVNNSSLIYVLKNEN